ncbi:MAG: M48 family metalloprotease [Capsulimonas sp.]|uniref:M48 family metalloprotease n=1 Tax=Capsulimonas sp. TaxID=2494211 RepID=UPI003263BF00
MGNRSATVGIRLIIALVIAGFSLIKYFTTSQVNPVTGQKQHVGVTTQQEIALGLQAAPEMEQQYGGEASNDPQGTAIVQSVGQEIVANSDAKKSPYQFQYHLLADPKTVNAFALPGGQIFITEALLRKLKTRGQLVGVLGHETGHVIARHSAQQLAKQQLTQGITGAAVMASYDPNNGSSRSSAAVAAAIGSLVNLKFSRGDESEADKWGVKLMAEAGYDPRAMLGVMQILEAESQGGHSPEFLQTHPNPENRMGKIKQNIVELYPNGIPAGLKP